MKAQMHNYSTWISEVNSDILKTYLKDKLVESGFGIEGFIEKYFYPHGYTCLFLLSESHLAVHTFPEEGKTYIELSSCVKFQFDKFIMSL